MNKVARGVIDWTVRPTLTPEGHLSITNKVIGIDPYGEIEKMEKIERNKEQFTSEVSEMLKY